MTIRALIMIASLAVLCGCAGSSQVRLRLAGDTPIVAEHELPVATPPTDASALRLRRSDSTDAAKIIGGVLLATSLVIMILINRSNDTP